MVVRAAEGVLGSHEAKKTGKKQPRQFLGSGRGVLYIPIIKAQMDSNSQTEMSVQGLCTQKGYVSDFVEFRVYMQLISSSQLLIGMN